MKNGWKSFVYLMKVTSLVYAIICGLAGVTLANDGMGQSLDMKVTVTFEDVALADALKTLEEKTGLEFVYSRNFIPVKERVSGSYRNKKLIQVLEALFVPYDISGKRINNQIVLSKKESKLVREEVVGSITGRVIDGANGQPLPGATVFVKGTTIGTASDLSGYYSILSVDGGEITLVCQYIGFETQEKKVTVGDGEELQVNFDLAVDVTNMQEVVITGNLEGQSRALNQQRASDNIKNIISADLMGRFPDLNTAEALQRIPGVNIERDNGEGGNVQLRGTPTNYTSIQVNGEQLPSNGLGGDRSPSLVLYPIDQLGSIEVSKSITPDQDGDAIGGIVNMVSPTAKNTIWEGKVEAGGGYNNLSKGVNGIGRFSVGRRFGADEEVTQGRFGILATGSFFQTDNGEDRTETVWAPTTFEGVDGGDNFEELALTRHDLRALNTQRTRAGAGLNLDYKISNKSSIRFNSMYSVLEEDEVRTRTRFRMDRNSVETAPLSREGSQIRKTFRDRVVNRDNLNLSLTGNYFIGLTEIDGGAFYTTTERDEDALRSDFRASDVGLAIQDVNSNFPQISSIDPSVRLNDATIYSDWNNYERYNRTNNTSNTALKLNVKQPVRLGNINGSIKGGYKYRLTTSERQRTTELYESFAGNSEGLFARFADYNAVSTDFLDGNASFGPGYNTSGLNSFFEQNINQFTRNTQGELDIDNPQFYGAEEVTNAAYLMAKLNFTSKLMILTGLRYEKLEVNYLANGVEAGSPDVIRSEGGTDYDFFLPNFQVKYSFTNLTNLRFAATRSFARPDFSDIVPSADINLEGGIVSRGNPELLPPVAWNFDLMFERYLGNLGILSVGAFYKRIENFEFNSSVFIEGQELFPASQDSLIVDNLFEVRQTLNGEEAEVWGMEVNIQANLDFLPGILSGFGVYGNYTFTGSNAFTSDRTDIRLPGQAEHTANAALTFDYEGFTAKASFNYQGDLFTELGDDPEGSRDGLRGSRYQLDLNTAYSFNNNWSVYAEFINITNQPQLEFFGDESRIRDVAFYSWWTRFGVSYRF